MKCSDAEKLILLADSGEIKPKQTALLAAHLRGCEPCSRFRLALSTARDELPELAEPAETVLQNIRREARLQAPQPKKAPAFHWKPAVALAASLLIGLGFFFSSTGPDSVGLDLVVTEAQFFSTAEQVSSVLYNGLSDDDLAFNFLMTFDGET